MRKSTATHCGVQLGMRVDVLEKALEVVELAVHFDVADEAEVVAVRHQQGVGAVELSLFFELLDQQRRPAPFNIAPINRLVIIISRIMRSGGHRNCTSNCTRADTFSYE